MSVSPVVVTLPSAEVIYARMVLAKAPRRFILGIGPSIAALAGLSGPIMVVHTAISHAYTYAYDAIVASERYGMTDEALVELEMFDGTSDVTVALLTHLVDDPEGKAELELRLAVRRTEIQLMLGLE